jgi:hypothetical protein
MRSFHFPDNLHPRSVCFPSNHMASSISSTYASYSAPTPYSVGSSTSLPNSSPISEQFEATTASEHHTGVTTDYVGYVAPSSSLPIYADMAYIPANSAHNYGYNTMNWSTSDHNIQAKRQPASSPCHRPQQYQQYSHYQQAPSQSLPNDMKARASMCAPPSPTAFHRRPQQHEQSSQTVIHSPVPIPVPTHIPSHSPSLPSHSAQSASVIQSHVQRMHPQPGTHPPMRTDALFDIDIDLEEWHPSSHPAHHRHFPPIYHHSRSHSTPTAHGYPLPSQSREFDVTRQQLQNERRARSDFSSCDLNDSITVKQEDSEIHAYPQPSMSQQHPPHAFDNEGRYFASHVQSPHPPPSPLSFSYYSPREPTQEHSVLYTEQQVYAMQSAALCSSDSPQSGYDVASPPEVGYSGEESQYKMPEGGYASIDSGYAVCDPRFVSNEGDEIRGHGVDGVLENGWDAIRRSVGGETAVYIGDRNIGWDGVNNEADAEGDDDLEGYGSSGYTGQQDGTLRLSDSPDSSGEYQPLSEKGDDGEEEEEGESEEDDSQDPEFVMRRRRASASYPPIDGRNFRSTRFTPYPSPTLSSSNTHYTNEVELQEQEQYQRELRSSRSYSHSNASVSPPPIASDSIVSTRRRARSSAVVPLPVPVPNLTKKSRGRRVPTMEELRAESATVVKNVNSRKKGVSTPSSKATRTYTCDVDGCGKLFARGEHLKRHVRSIHTYEKRQSLQLFSFLIFFWLTCHFTCL